MSDGGVCHGIDGFRVPTYAPAPGMGTDIAFRFFNSMDSYEAYIAGATHLIAVDAPEAVRAVVRLVEERNL